MGQMQPGLDVVSDSTFEVDMPSALSTISCAGDNSRLLLSIIHSAANNLLSVSEASRVLPVVLENGNRKTFQALIAGQSPATKAIARTFLPAALDSHSLDCPLVSTLLDTGINPNSCVDERRRRPLQLAIARQSMETTQLLLDRGADVNLHFVTYARDLDPKTPLEAAVQTGRLDLVQTLLLAGAHVNDPEPRERASALCVASQTGHLQLVQLLLDAGAQVNGPPRSAPPRIALQAAAGAGNIEIVQLLLSYGAEVSTRYISRGRHREPETALQFAASSGNIEITQLLLFHGAVDVVQALEFAGQSHHGHVVNHLVRSWVTSHALLDNEFGRTALRAATKCDDFELVRTLLERGAPTDGGTEWQTALQIAACHRNIEISQLLISYGANVNAPPSGHGRYGETQTALQAAVRRNHMQLVQVLLGHHADVNAPAGPESRTALAEAAYQGNLEILQLLLDWGADMDTHGASAVIGAIGHVTLDFLRFLLDAWTLASGGVLGWTVSEDCQQTALEVAVDTETPDVEVVRLLLEYEAGDTSLALRGALYAGGGALYVEGGGFFAEGVNIGVVELLLASGADVGYLDGDDDRIPFLAMTSLGWASRADRPDILGLLLEHRSGRTTAHDKSQALQTAAYDGRLDSARLLLDHGADVNAAPSVYLDESGRICRTALQAAAGNGNLEMVRLFLEAGADVESSVPSEDEEGTALQFAAIAGSMSVATLLIEKGADVNAPAVDEVGRTALEGAAEHGRLDIVQLLLNLGVEVVGSRAIQFAREEGHDGVVALLEEA